jgi:hypothetical protein
MYLDYEEHAAYVKIQMTIIDIQTKANCGWKIKTGMYSFGMLHHYWGQWALILYYSYRALSFDHITLDQQMHSYYTFLFTAIVL